MALPEAEAGGRQELQIGGQAVIEGVVMRGPQLWALAVRRPSGDIFLTVNPSDTLAARYPRANVAGLRGILALIDSLIIGMKSLSISADIALEEEKPETGTEAFEATGEATEEEEERAVEEPRSDGPLWEMWIALAFGVVLFIGLFIVLPTVIAKYLDAYLTNTVTYNLVEGGIRVAIFVLYLVAVSLVPDIRRVFQYHGAEHKVVHAYEHGSPLTPRATSFYSTAHVRCGTAFLLIVLVISILVFSLMGRPALWLRVLERILVIPLVAAVSYEIIKYAGRHESSSVMKVLLAPGLWLQSITTREPDEKQLEVAIVALRAALADGAQGRNPNPGG